MIIESFSNEYIKLVKSLSKKKYRDKYNMFLVEGEKVIFDIPKEWEIDNILLSKTYSEKIDLNLLSEQSYKIVADNIFNSISDTVTPQGIMAVCNKKAYDINEILKKENLNILLLENISDPGNLGTIIRTADATKFDLILLTKNSVDVYNSKVVRSTMGSIFNIPIVADIEIESIISILRDKDIEVYATDLKSSEYIYNVTFPKKVCTIIGNESKGISEYIRKEVKKYIKIPILGKAESLNASVAASVIMYEILRQKNY